MGRSKRSSWTQWLFGRRRGSPSRSLSTRQAAGAKGGRDLLVEKLEERVLPTVNARFVVTAMQDGGDMMDMGTATFTAGPQLDPPQVSVDKADYEPGSTAQVAGTGFAPGEQVTLAVIHNDTGNPAVGSNPWTVT